MCTYLIHIILIQSESRAITFSSRNRSVCKISKHEFSVVVVVVIVVALLFGCSCARSLATWLLTSIVSMAIKDVSKLITKTLILTYLCVLRVKKPFQNWSDCLVVHPGHKSCPPIFNNLISVGILWWLSTLCF